MHPHKSVTSADPAFFGLAKKAEQTKERNTKPLCDFHERSSGTFRILSELDKSVIQGTVGTDSFEFESRSPIDSLDKDGACESEPLHTRCTDHRTDEEAVTAAGVEGLDGILKSKYDRKKVLRAGAVSSVAHLIHCDGRQ